MTSLFSEPSLQTVNPVCVMSNTGLLWPQSLERAEQTMSTAQEASDNTNLVTLKTRFGVMEIDRNNAITVPMGMVGFADQKEFALIAPEHPALNGYMLLQSVQDERLTFILKPYLYDSGLLRPEDLAEVIQKHNINPEQMAIMLVTTIRQTPAGMRKSVNMRAPVFLDAERQMAWQNIFSSEDYNVRHPIH